MNLLIRVSTVGLTGPAPEARRRLLYIEPVSLFDRLRSLLPGANPLIPREPVAYRPIGVVRNRVREPRITGWADVRSDLILREELLPALDDLDGFSHVIVVFHLDRIPEDEKRVPRVRVGGEGGPEVGVFASRHPLRPNSIGVSVAEIVLRRKNVLRVRGLDALHGSPVLDLKPYLPPYDAVAEAKIPAWARGNPEP